jgi:hypothetical protein
MSKTMPDLGEMHPMGHPSGRVWQSPVSVEQARARVVYQMSAFEANVRDGIDTPYAIECLDEAIDDYYAMVLDQ